MSNNNKNNALLVQHPGHMLLRKREQKLRIHQAQDALLAIKTSDPSIHRQKTRKKYPFVKQRDEGKGATALRPGRKLGCGFTFGGGGGLDRRWGIRPAAAGDSTGGGALDRLQRKKARVSGDFRRPTRDCEPAGRKIAGGFTWGGGGIEAPRRGIRPAAGDSNVWSGRNRP